MIHQLHPLVNLFFFPYTVVNVGGITNTAGVFTLPKKGLYLITFQVPVTLKSTAQLLVGSTLYGPIFTTSTGVAGVLTGSYVLNNVTKGTNISLTLNGEIGTENLSGNGAISIVKL